MNAAVDQIRGEITSSGPISFARFMELALYAPGLGYYERAVDPIGRRGDFYTSVSVGRLFGELLTFQFVEWIASLQTAAPTELNNIGDRRIAVQIVEAGAHNGQLALDVLSWLKQFERELFDEIEYWIIEPSAARRLSQSTRLAGFGAKARWFSDWHEVPQPITGVIFANELLDAFPIHRFGWDAKLKQWFEWGVDWKQERFAWIRLAKCEGTPPQVEAELAEVLPDGYVKEISPQAVTWWQNAARTLQRGWLLTFDYGFLEEELMRPERADGTLRSYRGHRMTSDVLDSPGEQDITAHVDFAAIRRAGEAVGLETELLAAQALFLTRVAEATWSAGANFGDWTLERRRQFQTLIHPEHLGRAFRVLVQRRGSRFGGRD